MTNYDKIKNMSVKDLSYELEWFMDEASCYAMCRDGCTASSDSECAKHILNWLNKEADKDC